jgi:hypothetical protein
MLYFRVTSPLCWTGALVFFFLPWIEIRCNRESDAKLQFSGAQLAWGGQSNSVDGKTVQYTLGDLRRLGHSSYFAGVAVVLNAYPIALVIAIVCVLRNPPSCSRGRRSFWMAFILMAILCWGGWVIIGDYPFQQEAYETFTCWYYASYTVHLLAALSSVAEWRWCRNPESETK